MSIFTTREIAITFWLLFLFIILFVRKETRKSIIEFIMLLVGKHIRIVWASFFIYVGIITFILSRLSIWKYIYLKDIIIWTITSGVIVCMNSVDRMAKDDYVKKVLKDSLKPMILVELVLSTFTFPILIELIMIPFIAVVSTMEVFTEVRNEYASIKKFLNGVLGIIGIWILCGTISIAIKEYNQLDYSDTFISFVIPIVYLIAIIPLLLFWLYVGKYDTLFYRMSEYEDKTSLIKRIKKRIRVLHICGLSCDRITRFTRGFFYQSCTGMTEVDFDAILEMFKKDCNNDTWFLKNSSLDE